MILIHVPDLFWWTASPFARIQETKRQIKALNLDQSIIGPLIVPASLYDRAKRHQEWICQDVCGKSQHQSSPERLEMAQNYSVDEIDSDAAVSGSPKHGLSTAMTKIGRGSPLRTYMLNGTDPDELEASASG